VLVGDDIVAALDLKTDRRSRKLLLQKWNWVGNGARGARKELKRRIEEALHRFERFQLAEGARERSSQPRQRGAVQRPSFFVTRNFNSSSFDRRNFSSGDVLASLYPMTRSTVGGAPCIGRLTTVFGSRF
jgi:hypothetical protein